jgi:hypothetical protein
MHSDVVHGDDHQELSALRKARNPMMVSELNSEFSMMLFGRFRDATHFDFINAAWRAFRR